jgi:hypothetical protein
MILKNIAFSRKVLLPILLKTTVNQFGPNQLIFCWPLKNSSYVRRLMEVLVSLRWNCVRCLISILLLIGWTVLVSRWLVRRRTRKVKELYWLRCVLVTMLLLWDGNMLSFLTIDVLKVLIDTDWLIVYSYTILILLLSYLSIFINLYVYFLYK